MSQNTELKREPQAPIDWKELDESIRKMVVHRQWQEDLQKYNELKEKLDDNIQS